MHHISFYMFALYLVRTRNDLYSSQAPLQISDVEYGRGVECTPLHDPPDLIVSPRDSGRDYFRRREIVLDHEYLSQKNENDHSTVRQKKQASYR